MFLQGPMCGELSNNFEIFRVLNIIFLHLWCVYHHPLWFLREKNPFIKMCIYKSIYEKWPRLLGTTNKWDSNMPNYPWHM